MKALGIPWDRVDAEAEVLEHVLSEELEERMASILGHPARDPHGDPIPTMDGTVEDGPYKWLSDVTAGVHVRMMGCLTAIHGCSSIWLRSTWSPTLTWSSFVGSRLRDRCTFV